MAHLSRLQPKTKGGEVTASYWLGLNKIAEERWGTESGKSLAAYRPDPETGTSAPGNGWYIYFGGEAMNPVAMR